MAGASFSLEMKELSFGVAGALQHFAATQDLAASVGEAMVSSTRNRFDTETDPEGQKWKPSRRAEEEGGKTLTDKAILKNSYGYEATPDVVAWGTVEVYGGIHQKGGMTGRNHSVKMPKRASLGMDEDDREEVQGLLQDFMVEGFGR